MVIQVNSDKWLEQGAQVSGGTDTMITITYMKHFNSNNPSITLQRYSTANNDPGSGGLDRRHTVITNRTATNFYVWNATWGGLVYLTWKACSYMA